MERTLLRSRRSSSNCSRIVGVIRERMISERFSRLGINSNYKGGFMRTCLVVLLASTLQGCFFFYIPGSVFAAGNACATRNVQVGQRLYDAQTGKYGTIKEVHGRSDRCQTDERPILVTREFD
jgi:hypothetical protein